MEKTVKIWEAVDPYKLNCTIFWDFIRRKNALQTIDFGNLGSLGLHKVAVAV